MASDPSDAEVFQELQRSLEWATASTAVPDPAMDPRTAELRETWVAWSDLLERAEASLGPSCLPPCLPARSRRWLPLGLALVAGLAAVASGTIWLSLGPRSSDPSVALSEPTPENRQSLVAADSSTPGTAENSSSSVASADPSLEWDDAADNDIAELSDWVVGVQRSWRKRLDAMDLVWCGVLQIRSEIDSEPQ